MFKSSAIRQQPSCPKSETDLKLLGLQRVQECSTSDVSIQLSCLAHLWWCEVGVSMVHGVSVSYTVYLLYVLSMHSLPTAKLPKSASSAAAGGALAAG